MRNERKSTLTDRHCNYETIELAQTKSERGGTDSFRPSAQVSDFLQYYHHSFQKLAKLVIRKHNPDPSVRCKRTECDTERVRTFAASNLDGGSTWIFNIRLHSTLLHVLQTCRAISSDRSLRHQKRRIMISGAQTILEEQIL